MPGQSKENKNKNFFSFKSKSENLRALYGRVESALILDQVAFEVGDVKNALKKIADKGWLDKKLIVRSSAVSEDGLISSMAGYFQSILNVEGEADLVKAINDVIKSFSDDNPANQVFVQPMLLDVRLSGVVFTKEQSSGAPYYVINFDDQSGSTDSVTSGMGQKLRTFYCHKLHKISFGDFRDKVLALCRELEEITNSDSLDIEFAIDGKGGVYLFQVRPLMINKLFKIDEPEHYKIIQEVNLRLESWMKKHPYLCGNTAIYGVMPDWNPAEIIGIRPNPLAISLYREVVTNAIWAYQRDNYGYRNLRSFPLLVEFEGMPYVDIRVSFNSFVPASLSEVIAEKLVNFYLNKLRNNPNLHDKVEFEIVFSCYTFDMSNRLSALDREGFFGEEIVQIKKSLLDLTNKIISGESSLWRKDLEKIEILKERHQKIIASDLDGYSKLYWLIEDCKRYGTLPFAGLARAAFIAVEILKSMVTEKLIDAKEYDDFLASLNTVSSSIGKDFCELSKDEFLSIYGHLRPGTYDILSKRYDEDPDGYFNWSERSVAENKECVFELSSEKTDRIDLALKNAGFEIKAKDLFNFFKGAIEAREYSKFIFTRSISDFLKIYGDICIRDLGISIEDASYTHVGSVMSLASISSDPKKIITASIERRKKRFSDTKNINLPAIITDPENVFCFYELESQPNYVTQNKVSGEIEILEDGDKDISGRIVMIPSADPGYDWIFSHKISGLITKYGGVNSHMAIRAAELGIPAVIGAGKYYEIWKKNEKIILDCMSKIVIKLK